MSDETTTNTIMDIELTPEVVTYIGDIKKKDSPGSFLPIYRVFKPAMAKILVDMFLKNGIVAKVSPNFKRVYIPIKDGGMEAGYIASPDYFNKTFERGTLYVRTSERGLTEDEKVKYREAIKKVANEFIALVQNEMKNNPFGGKRKRKTRGRSRKTKKSRKH